MTLTISPALATSVTFTDDEIIVILTDGRSLSVPIVWFPRLAKATASQRADYELMGNGEGIHWPQIDEDISVSGLLAGRTSVEFGRQYGKTKPPTDALEELTEFFDANDMGDYWPTMPEVEFEITLARRTRLVAIEEALAERVAKIAKDKNVSPEVLIQTWLEEKLELTDQDAV